jgi:hypothetical protein
MTDCRTQDPSSPKVGCLKSKLGTMRRCPESYFGGLEFVGLNSEVLSRSHSICAKVGCVGSRYPSRWSDSIGVETLVHTKMQC